MSSDYAPTIERVESRRTARRPWRSLVIQLLGPLTVLAGLVWAVAQPYRIVFLDPHARKGFYDYVVQPPLLVVVVGIVYALLLAPGLVEDLEGRNDGSAR